MASLTNCVVIARAVRALPPGTFSAKNSMRLCEWCGVARPGPWSGRMRFMLKKGLYFRGFRNE